MAMQTLPVTASPAEAIVFDFGGVLFNWQPPKLIQQVWPHHARTDDEALALAQEVFQSFVPGCDWSEFDRGVLSRDETLRRIAARTGLPLADLDALVSAIPPHLAPVQPTVAWLERLAAAGVRLHFLSNMPRPYADFLEAQHPFLRHFRSGVFSCDVHEVKPGEGIFRIAQERLDVNPARTVFIDDHPRNVEMACALGWQAIQFVDAAQCELALRQSGWLAPGL